MAWPTNWAQTKADEKASTYTPGMVMKVWRDRYTIPAGASEDDYPTVGTLRPGEEDTATAFRMQRIVQVKPNSKGQIEIFVEFAAPRTK